MKRGGLLSISELAKYARITRTALIHYDSIGLLTPVERGGNNYRYYSYRQITKTNLIMTLQSLGLTLSEIAEIIEKRTPENIGEIFSRQSIHIDSEIKRLKNAKALLDTLTGIIKMGLEADEDAIETKFEEEEPILIGPKIDYSRNRTTDEAILDFYKYCAKLDPEMDLNYPVWGIFEESRIKRRDWKLPSRFYFRKPDGPGRKPAGLYAVAYGRGHYGATDALYSRLLDYIDKNDLVICGDTYEMYPLNEISVYDEDNYLIKTSIMVRPRDPLIPKLNIR
jgi:DNA-binding transcriptional MerR regulator